MSWLTSGGFIVPFVILLLAVGFVLTVKYAASRYRKVSPGRVGIFYGRDFKWKDGTVHGHLLLASGGRVQRPILESYTEISTSAFQVTIDEKDIPNKDNVRVTIKGVATCKISDDPAGLNNAVAAILPMLDQGTPSKGSTNALNDFVLNILKGHLRSIIGKLDINGLLRERDQFNKQMVEESKVELQGLGIDLKNLVIQDINDTLGYIDALGRQAVAQAKAQADINVSNAEMGAKTTVAGNEATVAEANRDRDVKVAQAKATADRENAIANMALQIATAAQQQALVVAEADRDAAQKTAQVKVQEQERARRTAELEATVVAQATADKQKTIIDAEAKNKVTVIEAEAKRDAANANKEARIAEGEGNAAKEQAELTGKAKGDAAATEEDLLAKARGTQKLAEAYNSMAETAKLILILDRLPVLFEKGGIAGAMIFEAIFKSVAAPFGEIDSINIVDMGSGSNGSDALSKLGMVVPKTVFDLVAKAKAQGLDFTSLLKMLGIDASKAMSMLSVKPADGHATEVPASVVAETPTAPASAPSQA